MEFHKSESNDFKYFKSSPQELESDRINENRSKNKLYSKDRIPSFDFLEDKETQFLRFKNYVTQAFEMFKTGRVWKNFFEEVLIKFVPFLDSFAVNEGKIKIVHSDFYIFMEDPKLGILFVYFYQDCFKNKSELNQFLSSLNLLNEFVTNHWNLLCLFDNSSENDYSQQNSKKKWTPVAQNQQELSHSDPIPQNFQIEQPNQVNIMQDRNIFARSTFSSDPFQEQKVNLNSPFVYNPTDQSDSLKNLPIFAEKAIFSEEFKKQNLQNLFSSKQKNHAIEFSSNSKNRLQVESVQSIFHNDSKTSNIAQAQNFQKNENQEEGMQIEQNSFHANSLQKLSRGLEINEELSKYCQMRKNDQNQFSQRKEIILSSPYPNSHFKNIGVNENELLDVCSNIAVHNSEGNFSKCINSGSISKISNPGEHSNSRFFHPNEITRQNINQYSENKISNFNENLLFHSKDQKNNDLFLKNRHLENKNLDSSNGKQNSSKMEIETSKIKEKKH